MEYTRRDILRTSAIGGLGLTVGGAIAAAPPAEAATEPTRSAESTASPHGGDAIHAYYLSQGGAAGRLGVPHGPAQAIHNSSGVPGLLQNYRGVVYGTTSTCQHPTAGTPVESVVVWSAATGAHALYGSVRDNWLKTGGAAGKYGFPLGTGSDLSVRFERGKLSEQ